MENLIIKKKDTFQIETPISDYLVELSFINNSVCCYVLKSNQIEVLRHTSMEKISMKLPTEVGAEESIVNLYYSKDRELLLVATDTYLIAHDFSEQRCTVHKLDAHSKILHASWNPSESHVVIVTENDELFSYSLSYSVASKDYTFFLSHSGSLNKPVPITAYVGWGAHLTQFRGIKKLEEKIEEIPQDYERPVVSWRGNGEMFVVNFWRKNKRVLKVFDNRCLPLHCSENHTNLLAPISFKSMGNFIATCSVNGKTNNIDVIEKNCLIRSMFVAPDIKGKIRNLKFHPDKALLAVQSDTQFESQLNIYYYIHKTWYLKQQFNYSLEGNNELLVTFNWGKGIGTPFCDLYVFTTRGISCYNFALDIYGAANQLVAVINGSKVLFTNFKKEIVPPPAASFTTVFANPVNVILYYPSEDIYAFHLSDNSVVQNTYKNLLKGIPGENIKELNCKSVENCMTTFENVVNGVLHKFYLDKSKEFFIDGTLVTDNVISIYATEKYLLLVKVQSNDYKLYCVRLTDVVKMYTIENSYSRNIGHGGKIIGLNNNQFVVMITPRPDLETATCRLIDIDVIEEALDHNKWDQAIYLMRDRKLDWNLLIDLNKVRFNTYMQDFIIAADTLSVINTILSEFKTENCLKKLYNFWRPNKSPKELYLKERSDAIIKKIGIFTTLLQELVKQNPIRFMTGIMKMQVKHFSLKAALCTLLNFYHLGEHYHGACKTGLKVITQIRDLKEIVSIAAGLFDVDFLEFIYTECSEDPLQHILEMSGLRKLKETNEAQFRFEMCHKANDFDMATKYLLRVSDELESNLNYIENYIQSHRTAKAAYEGLSFSNVYFKTVTQLYAAELSEEHKPNEAGMILERAGLYKGALKCYKIIRDWRKSIGVLSKCVGSRDYKQQIYRSISKYLCEHGQIDDAAMILSRFVGDRDAALQLYIQQNQFSSALFLLRQYNTEASEIDAKIKPHLRRYCQELLNRIEFLDKAIVALVWRLKIIRNERIEKYLTLQSMTNKGYMEEGAGECGNDSEYGSDIYSSKHSSRASRSSTVSARNRRRQERRKIDLREGGVYEDIAIVRELHITINKIIDLSPVVYEVCNITFDEEHFTSATELQAGLRSLHETVRIYIPQIWSDVFVNAEYSTEPRILGVIENRSEIDPIYLTPPKIDQVENWELSIYNVNEN